MTSSLMNYTTRSQVEQFLNRTFSEVGATEFNNYLLAAEAYINNYLGYNAETTTSGIISESIVREKNLGKVDPNGNLVIDLMKPPVHTDSNNNPLVTLVEFNFGGVRVPLQLTDNTTNALNTLLEVSENRKKVIYPSIYFMPFLPTVTPTAKVNLFNIKDIKFWVDISYVGGYSTVPGDIVLAANYLAGEMLTHRDNPNFAIRVKQGSYDVEYLPTRGGSKSDNLPSQTFSYVDRLLQPYVRVTW